MNKKKQLTEEEITRQVAEAAARSKQRLEAEPRALAARYDKKSKRIVVDLSNNCTFMFPAEIGQGLSSATDSELAKVEIASGGYGLHWETLDADLTITGLLAGVFGTKKWMSELGRAGGSAISEAKAASSRANGTKGGRPRKSKIA
ncbi:MAG: DUF2442 domain-containing protein [Pyrinomonadaceae bacterium MAG19_C2-C3]|nr:DUF2442 domain-containing protein [Pyrinomonadaceae bacterium MAG19_C2-C3]